MIHKSGFYVITTIFLSILIVLIFIIIFRKDKKENYKKKNKILFTCTSYISLQGKFEELYKALVLFFKFNDYNSIDRFIVINEYSKIDTTNKINFLKEKFPQVDFIQKKRNKKGQANSLNIIINILRRNKYDYWIQWEESWFPNRNFIKDAIEIMTESKIDQLQFTNDWFNVEKERRHEFKNYVEIDKIPGNYSDENINFWKKDLTKWPLYSLRPCINRVSTMLPLRYFNTSKEKWPVQFEFEYAYKWAQQGLKKGIMKNPPVERKGNRRSTYSYK